MADLFPGATAQQVGGYFPRSGIEPQLVVSVVHITAGLGDALAIAKSVEAKQVTASFWTNRDGRIYQTMLDPVHMGPWTNGVLNAPDLSNARIARMKSDGVNPNKRSLLTIENAGLEPGSPITAAQERACANIIGHYHRKYGVPITRETVVGHYQFDSVNRRNCPSTNKAILDRIVAMAQGGSAGDEVITVTLTQFRGANGEPENRPVDFQPGTVRGYHLDGSGKDFTIGGTGSWARADGRCKIEGRSDAPVGYPFVRMIDGVFATGAPWYVFEDGVKVKARPDPPVAVPPSQAAADVAAAAVEQAKKYQ